MLEIFFKFLAGILILAGVIAVFYAFIKLFFLKYEFSERQGSFLAPMHFSDLSPYEKRKLKRLWIIIFIGIMDMIIVGYLFEMVGSNAK